MRILEPKIVLVFCGYWSYLIVTKTFKYDNCKKPEPLLILTTGQKLLAANFLFSFKYTVDSAKSCCK